MTWNYRVVKTVCAVLSVRDGSLPRHEDGYTSYGIHEVFYDDDDLPCACTQAPIDVFADSEQELRESYNMMKEAFEQAVLTDKDFTGRSNG